MKSVETSSSRGIVYPEDIELQGDSDEDRERAATRMHGGEKLGFKPAVHTEIVGAPEPSLSWSRSVNKGIEVKRDFVIQRNNQYP